MNKSDIKNGPNKLIVISGILSPFIGIYSGIYGINQIENYFHPYLFSLTCAIIGLVIGWTFSMLIKPYTRFNKKQLNNYSTSIIFFSSGFIGLMLAFGSWLNSELSTETSNLNCKLVDKTYKSYSFANPSAHWLHLPINGKTEKLRCNSEYWESVMPGQLINISTFKSKIGFDYYILTNE